MNSTIEKFFNYISNRIYNENRLSDITWALCQSSEHFETFFLKFFFKEEVKFDISREIIREYTTGNSRVDFWIRNGEKTFIIEVKIYDRNQHFDQYNKAYPNAKKGYITNYYLEEQDGYEIRTWKELYKELNQHLQDEDKIPVDEKNLIKGYISYLKNVCSIIEIEKMNLTNLKSLQDFNLLCNEIIIEPFNSKNGTDKYSCQLNNQTKGSNDYAYGKDFTTLKNGKRLFVGDAWLGVQMVDGKILVYVPYHNDISSAFHSLKTALEKSNLRDNDYFCKPYIVESDPWGFYFELEKQYLAEINKEETTLEIQRKIITSFFQEVILYVDDYKKRYPKK